MNKIAVSDAVRAEYVEAAKAVHKEQGGGTYGQDMDAITKLRLLRKLAPDMASKKFGGKLSDDSYTKLVQFMKLGSNAHAINVDINNLGGSKKTPLAVDLANSIG